MCDSELNKINEMIIDQLDKLVLLCNKEIVQPSNIETPLELLIHKLIELNVESLSIKKNILKILHQKEKKEISHVI